MTVTEAPSTARSTDPETARVEAALDALLAAHDPTTTDNVAFRGARYDAGLAWVHFPEGFGGLGVRPDLNKLVEQRLRAAGAQPTDPAHVLHGPRRADDRHPRQRRGARALPAPDVHRRGGLVPAVLRAGCRLRLRRPRHPGGHATATSGSSTGRRCGTRWPTSPTSACSSPAPIPTRRSTRG